MISFAFSSTHSTFVNTSSAENFFQARNRAVNRFDSFLGETAILIWSYPIGGKSFNMTISQYYRGCKIIGFLISFIALHCQAQVSQSRHTRKSKPGASCMEYYSCDQCAVLLRKQ